MLGVGAGGARDAYKIMRLRNTVFNPVNIDISSQKLMSNSICLDLAYRELEASFSEPQQAGNHSGGRFPSRQLTGNGASAHFPAFPQHTCLRLPNHAEMLLAAAGCPAAAAANLSCPDCLVCLSPRTSSDHSSRQGSRSGSPRGSGSLSPHRKPSGAERNCGGESVYAGGGRSPVGGPMTSPMLAAGRVSPATNPACCHEYG
jgi:hypothetical protein